MHQQLVKPSDENSVNFPSEVGGTHAQAFATNDEGPGLHTLFNITSLVDLNAAVGLTMFFLCGGSAPVDIICVTLVQKAEGDTKAELQIRLCDAKQVTSASSTLEKSVLEEMILKFAMVRNFLQYHLSKKYPKYTITFMHDAIVTSATKVSTTGAGNIVLISPKTCDFRPLSDWWFSTGILPKDESDHTANV